MTEELITFETAKLAKEKGFDEECMSSFEWYITQGKEFGPIAHSRPLVDFREMDAGLWEAAQKRPGLYNPIYNPIKNSTSKPWLYCRPSQDLLERWLRENHGILAGVLPCYSAHGHPDKYEPAVKSKTTVITHTTLEQFDTYERARETALLIALTLLP